MAKDRELSIQDFQSTIDDAGVKIRILRSEWMTPFHVNDRQAKHYRKGNIFLAGDASHIHSPVAGQGMNTGIQDAANLCWKISAIERGSDASDSLLDSYETERAEVGRALLTKTGTALKLVTSGNTLATGLRDVIAPHVSEIRTVQKAISGFISETAIEYRSSPVIVDKGGDGELRAGDRLTDVGLISGSTLLEHWTSGRPLTVLLNATESTYAELTAALTHSDVITVRSEDVDVDGRRQFGRSPSLLLVRPDGYIGFRGSPDDTDSWHAYARQNAL